MQDVASKNLLLLLKEQALETALSFHLTKCCYWNHSNYSRKLQK